MDAKRIVIDTDLGVDDAAAIAWLAAQRGAGVEIAGVTTVWGNTTSANATRNAVALLDALDRRDIPVVGGAAEPLERKGRSRIGAVAHGDDGLWGAAAGADSARAGRDVVAFYRDFPAEGATLLALGPLTNLARTLRAEPKALRRFARIVVLGGAKHHGSMTPVSETNFWHDPEAADEVLSASLPITLVTRDAHRAFVLSKDDLAALARSESPAARFLSAPMAAYARVTGQLGEPINFPDIVAAVIAVERAVATEVRPALVRIARGSDSLTRGQSIVGVSTNERLTMIDRGAAIDGAIEVMLGSSPLGTRELIAGLLAREPPNAEVVLGIDAEAVRARFMRGITGGRA